MKILLVLFATFGLQRLTGEIDWSLWWVFSPLIVAATWLVLGLFVVAGAITAAGEAGLDRLGAKRSARVRNLGRDK